MSDLEQPADELNPADAADPSEEPTEQAEEDVTDEELIRTQAAETGEPVDLVDADPAAETAEPAAETESVPAEATETATDALPAEGETAESAANANAETETEEESTEPPKELAPEALAYCRSAVEAILFSQAEPLTVRKIAEAIDVRGADSRAIRKIITDLTAEYQRDSRGFAIEEIAGGFQLLTRPDLADCVARVGGGPGSAKLSQAALETLAVVAYKQPVTRADIEAIRGVQAGPLLRTLLQKHLVRITGRAEILGRPLLYGTTKEFLEYFGLKSLNELPKVEELPRP